MLEPLAVLSLLLGGQKVSLGFFTIIIFGMCACAVEYVITRRVERISLSKVVMRGL